MGREGGGGGGVGHRVGSDGVEGCHPHSECLRQGRHGPADPAQADDAHDAAFELDEEGRGRHREMVAEAERRAAGLVEDAEVRASKIVEEAEHEAARILEMAQGQDTPAPVVAPEEPTSPNGDRMWCWALLSATCGRPRNSRSTATTASVAMSAAWAIAAAASALASRKKSMTMNGCTLEARSDGLSGMGCAPAGSDLPLPSR